MLSFAKVSLKRALMSSPLRFKIQPSSLHADSAARTGELLVLNTEINQGDVIGGQESSKRTIQTPGCFMFSTKGSVPHLTPDMMRQQRYGGINVFLEQLLQPDQPASFSKWPSKEYTLANYLYLQDLILLCDSRDPSYTYPSLSPTTSTNDASTKRIGSNTDRHVFLSTPKGVRPLTLEDYLRVVRQYRPDIVVAMADNFQANNKTDIKGSKSSNEEPDQKKKRVQKSINRTLKWLDQILLERQGKDGMIEDRKIEEEKRRKREKREKRRTLAKEEQEQGQGQEQRQEPMQGKQCQDSGTNSPIEVSEIQTEPWMDVSVFAHVQGGQFEDERIRSAKETSERIEVDGFIMDVGSMSNAGSEKEKEDMFKFIQISLKYLPKEKPKMAYGIHAPEDILKAVALGVDLFDTSYPYQLTEDGKASLYFFGPNGSLSSSKMMRGAVGSNNRWLNLWDEGHSDKFIPILEGCGCYACKDNRHTRAYINHLLKAHEMLATVLLMSHNLYQYSIFFDAIREAIASGTLNQYTKEFELHFGVEPVRTNEKHQTQILVEAALMKRNQRLETAEAGVVDVIGSGVSLEDESVSQNFVNKRPISQSEGSEDSDRKKPKKSEDHDNAAS